MARARLPRRWRPSLTAAYLGLTVVGVGLTLSSTGCSRDAEAAAEAVPAETNALPADFDPRQSLAPMIKAVGPAVVAVDARGTPPGRARGPVAEPAIRGRGSGFIIDADGLVVTNHHVIEGAKTVGVRLPDGRSFEARVIGSDPATDLALLELQDAQELPVASLGRSETLEVGDWVVAMGNPMGLEHSATVGIVSGKGRGSLGLYRDSYIDFLQTDADIAPGSSGGPLFNLRGEVVGINTAVGAGLRPGFSIPVDQARRIIEQLRERGEVVRGWLGAANVPGAEGAVIGRVYAGTPAEQAGLRSGDVVERIDGAPIDDFEGLRAGVATHAPGDEVELEIRRDGERYTLKATLGARPDASALPRLRAADGETPWAEPAPPRRDPAPFTLPFGLGEPPAEPPTGAPDRGPSERLGVRARPSSEGLEVVEVAAGSLGETLGLRPGDRLRSLNGKALERPADVATALREGSSTIELRFERDGATHVTTLER